MQASAHHIKCNNIRRDDKTHDAVLCEKGKRTKAEEYTLSYYSSKQVKIPKYVFFVICPSYNSLLKKHNFSCIEMLGLNKNDFYH